MLREKVLACAMCFWATVAWAQEIRFDGHDYRLAQVEISDQEIRNRYVPKADTQGIWKPRLSVHVFRENSSVAELLPSHIDKVRSALIDAPLTVKREGASDDVIVVLFCKTADKNVTEYVLQRFVRGQDGIVSYRFNQNIHGNVDMEQVLARQTQRIEQLFKLSPPIKTSL